jgi:biotin carboxyl carrier protein
MSRYTVHIGEATHVVEVEDRGPGRYTVRLAGGKVLDATLEDTPEPSPDHVPGADPVPSPDVFRGGGPSPAERRHGGGGSPLTDALPHKIAGLAAPLPGVVLTCHVVVGQHVIKGETVLVIEAMKMKNDIKAPAEATVTKVLVKAGDTVQHGTPLIEFEL